MVRLYCETQEGEPIDILGRLTEVAEQYKPDGLMLLRCAMMDSSYFGQRVILPYGPKCTFKTPPALPVSPRGLASDMSTVEAITVLTYEQAT